MQKMFSDCISLNSLDITTFNTLNCKDFTDMFENDKLDLYIDSTKCQNLMDEIFSNTDINLHDNS